MKKTIAFLLCCALLCMCACSAGNGVSSAGTQTVSEAEQITPDEEPAGAAAESSSRTESSAAEEKAPEGGNAYMLTDFALELLKNSGGENTLVSPVSLLYALAMTANGAKGETRAQFEKLFGMTIDEVNDMLRDYAGRTAADEGVKFRLANSLWLNSAFSGDILPEFLQNTDTFYSAEVCALPFDAEAVSRINSYVAEHTENRIRDLLTQLSQDGVMCLVNALAFDGNWEKPYTEDKILDGAFTNSAGAEEAVTMMKSREHAYLEDGGAAGMMKFYEGGSFAFAALLPPEGMTPRAYLDTLTGEKLHDIVSGYEEITVNAAIPKFRTEYSGEMRQTLQAMGLTDAFGANADFSGMCDTPVSVSSVLHKTFLRVDEAGTQAGAASAVIMTRGMARADNSRTVTFDRPFLYMIVDTETCLPVFLGILDSAG